MLTRKGTDGNGVESHGLHDHMRDDSFEYVEGRRL